LSRIIEPLASRCSKFRFKPLDPSSTSARLQQVADAEHVPVTPVVIDTLISASQGDLRRSITYLQSASRLSASTNPPIPITPTDIQEIAGVVPDIVVKRFATALGVEVEDPNGDAMDIDDGPQAHGKTGKPGFDIVRNKVKEIIREGYSASQLLSQVTNHITPIKSESINQSMSLAA
jgi:replication factor C subunit 2/4